METIYLLIIMVLGQWFGDFVVQDDELAAGKHKDFTKLLLHCLQYSLVFLIFGIICAIFGLFNVSIIGAFLFFGLTFGEHILVDHVMSSIGYVELENGNQNTFLGYMLMDQGIHYLCLIMTYLLLF